MSWLTTLLGPIVETAGGLWKNRQERKARKNELDQEIHLQKIDYVKQGRIAEVEWNRTAKQTSGWIDDYLTIILSLPMIFVFFPDMVPHIKAGFAVLDETPVWYSSAIAVMISAGSLRASFLVRSQAAPFATSLAWSAAWTKWPRKSQKS